MDSNDIEYDCDTCEHRECFDCPHISPFEQHLIDNTIIVDANTYFLRLPF